jgi:hypothetical protein
MNVSLLYRWRWINFKSFCNIPSYTEGKNPFLKHSLYEFFFMKQVRLGYVMLGCFYECFSIIQMALDKFQEFL